MIEIDRVMFVSCRLCLEKWGDYQIVPSIQQQIKFCYDIEVNPFDGLPQLICKECESTLSNFAAAKNTYIEKQKNIRPALKDKIAKLTKAAVNSEQEIISATLQLSNEKENKRKKKIALYSALSDDSGTDSSLITTVKNKNEAFERIKRRKTSDFSDENYEKLFICRFCNKCRKSKAGIMRHINVHSSMLCMYQTYIKGSCYVRLNRVDDKPNICKSKHIVVHSRDHCVKSEHDFYYSVFKPNTSANTCNKQNPSTVFEKVAKSSYTCSSSEISDSELNLKNRKKKKLKKQNSRRCDEVIVVEDHDMKSTKCNTLSIITPEATISLNCKTSKSNENEYIDICDYSDSESYKIVSEEKNYSIADMNLPSRTSEFKTIQNVISVCLKKYLKKLESVQSVPQLSRHVNEKQLDYSIKHKVLSIGRKIINNSAFSYIDILKYLEHQNLEIAWIPRVQSNVKKPDYVRIMLKLKDYNDNEHHDLGWQKLKDMNKKNCNYEIISPSITEKKSLKESLRESTNMISNNVMETKEALITDIEDTSANKVDNEMLKKLFNQNPTSHPKQPPKKNIPSELPNNKNHRKAINEVDQPIDVDVENNVISADVFQMPVITSAVSLASVVESESENTSCMVLPNVANQNITNEPHTPLDTMKKFPRIKVKPVTELMSERVLSTIHKQQIDQEDNVNSPNVNITVQNHIGNIPDVSIPKLNHLKNYQLQVNEKQNDSVAETNDKTEYVIMDTIDIPCKRTDSPFRYFKDLLHINNIILLDVTEKMSWDFTSLLKFQLKFQQETTSPVVLCLALFYSKKRFCLQVKDINQKEIDITKLSASWQWEILKVCRGDIVTKFLENAQKLSPEVCYMTSKFLSYLKSINFRNET